MLENDYFESGGNIDEEKEVALINVSLGVSLFLDPCNFIRTAQIANVFVLRLISSLLIPIYSFDDSIHW